MTVSDSGSGPIVVVRRRTTPTSTPTPTTSAAIKVVGTSKRPMPSIEKARLVLGQARRLRAEYMYAVTDGMVTPDDVIRAAATADGEPLRRISLRQLLISQPGWGERRTRRMLSDLSAKLGNRDKTTDMTVSWLLDPRTGGRRWAAWLDVQRAKQGAPVTGFPSIGIEELQ